MSGEGNGQAAEAPARPRIVIEFAGPGMADCSVTPTPDVTLSQLYGAAWLIDAWAHEARLGQVAAARSPIVAGAPGVQDLLAQLGLGGPRRDG